MKKPDITWLELLLFILYAPIAIAANIIDDLKDGMKNGARSD